MRQEDTIAAIATPPGHGGVGIIRISGPDSHAILGRLFLPASPRFAGFRPWTLHRGRACDATGAPLDDVLAVAMPGPRTFTGEDVAEIHCHGGPAVLAAVLEAACACGARLAGRGEFTRRAFLNGRMDLTQAEAVAEMIAAPAQGGLRLAQARLQGLLGTRVAELRARLLDLRAQLCVAVDFPEDEVDCLAPEAFVAECDAVAAGVRGLLSAHERGRCWQEGALVVLAGHVNAGKSSLMNALLGRRRAIVTDMPGTTRDFIEEPVQLAGLPVRLVDTAGLRDTGDIVEQEGVRISRDLVAQADLVLLVVDAAAGLGHAERELLRHVRDQHAQGGRPDRPGGRVLVVLNKTDLAAEAGAAFRCPTEVEGCPCVAVSALRGLGVDELAAAARAMVLAGLGGDDAGGEPESGDLAPNLRQAQVLRRALDELDALVADVRAGVPYDLCSVRLDGACAVLSEITGETTPAEVLEHIFSSFCIGK
ncbi:tRNA uridine-5-carboxymethylaminomethyl(34) synthesis GTPase MnmE [Nitratidesulfovibrio sp. SRB-5]|uniref:tRNA uridine-5-carboxymethylaminomethyl(34) synthesis GTPase MnmE n=1 Tax=Nitratidesulfovibrio sp. SRB-5 TaxID=2872636 RepID=UPI001025EB70|nr:tRNA uridine-5-carboxymethylaminomethyl(34) synthesis GTPase MnmE [Nitratidesulfovibrio sp. SRB-5]MBZ2172798.1 tRNA uridine-5-carboxymethylaminomethyl(34) synthesis GTPase MnmE [Nitratidesulfovibrio sp. SRB-5]RXF73826.1 tRNA uridine-5-carboxymethylaminomethyl(34) synthesis GTPase MnmE [Desulfovibrio sp. DS-1]